MKDTNNKKFLFKELVKREYVRRYKRTALGQLWNILSPLLLMLVMDTVYSVLFSRTEHYTIYLFAGYIQYSFFNSTTSGTLRVLHDNAHIFNKVRVNKLDFVIAHNVSNIVTYFIMFLIFLAFMLFGGLKITPTTLLLLYPMICEIILAYALGLIIATIYVFFQDIKYLYPLYMRITMYLSAVFYNPAKFPEVFQKLMWISPLYPTVYFFREVALENRAPAIGVWLYIAAMTAAVAVFSVILFKKTEKKFYLYM